MNVTSYAYAAQPASEGEGSTKFLPCPPVALLSVLCHRAALAVVPSRSITLQKWNSPQGRQVHYIYAAAVSVMFAVLEVSFWALTTVVKLVWKFLTLILDYGPFKIIESGTIRKLWYLSYWHSIVTMALYCIVSEIKRDVGRKSRFVILPAFDAPVS